jgi:hypothetical protein
VKGTIADTGDASLILVGGVTIKGQFHTAFMGCAFEPNPLAVLLAIAFSA